MFARPQVLLAIFVYFLHQIALYSVTFFLPAIVRAWGGLSELGIGLSTALPWLCAAAGAAFLPKLATRLGLARHMMIAGLFVMAAALAAPAFASPTVGLIAFCVCALLFVPVQSVLFTYPSARFQGIALAGGLGFLNSLGILGGFVGPSGDGPGRGADGQGVERPAAALGRPGGRRPRRLPAAAALIQDRPRRWHVALPAAEPNCAGRARPFPVPGLEGVGREAEAGGIVDQPEIGGGPGLVERFSSALDSGLNPGAAPR